MHDDFRRANHDHWRSYDDHVMMFVSRVIAPSAFRHNASAGGKEGDDAA
jgi:hypothetical protein